MIKQQNQVPADLLLFHPDEFIAVVVAARIPCWGVSTLYILNEV